MTSPVVDLLIYHGGSMSLQNFEYVGGDVLDLPSIDADRLCFMDLANIIEDELGYPDNGSMYYKFDDDGYEGIHGLTSDKSINLMFDELVKAGRRKLHVYVEHGVAVHEPVVPEPDQPPQPNHPPQPNQPAQHDETLVNLTTDDLPLSDYEPSENDEPEIFDEREEILKAAREATTRWFQPWANTLSSTKKTIEVDAKANWEDLDDYHPHSDDVMSIDTDECDEKQDEDNEQSSTHVRRKKRYPEWNAVHDLTTNVKLELGSRFQNPTEFKDALRLYAIQNGFDYNYMHNDKRWVSAFCKKKCCWRIHASWMNAKKSFQIKTLFDVHNCGNHYKNKRATVKWAAERYLNNFRDQPDWKASALKEAIRRDYSLDFTLLSCHRAKRMALSIINGRHHDQYRHTREYAMALLKWNAGSSAYVRRDGVFFQRMYICLDGCKKGFLAGCRPMICLDACFLKGEFAGQLHAAVARDGNDDIYPIAFAVCESESKDTWTWFLSILLEDIVGPHDHLWSFMSDRQKVITCNICMYLYCMVIL
jgi:hypothetical protein